MPTRRPLPCGAHLGLRAFGRKGQDCWCSRPPRAPGGHRFPGDGWRLSVIPLLDFFAVRKDFLLPAGISFSTTTFRRSEQPTAETTFHNAAISMSAMAPAQSPFCLLPFAFCLLPFAFCLLPLVAAKGRPVSGTQIARAFRHGAPPFRQRRFSVAERGAAASPKTPEGCDASGDLFANSPIRHRVTAPGRPAPTAARKMKCAAPRRTPSDRCIDVVKQIANSEAREFPDWLTGRAPDAQLTLQAKSTSDRLRILAR